MCYVRQQYGMWSAHFAAVVAAVFARHVCTQFHSSLAAQIYSSLISLSMSFSGNTLSLCCCLLEKFLERPLCEVNFSSFSCLLRRHDVFRSSVRPSVVDQLSAGQHVFRMTQYFCTYSGGILMKLAVNIHHVSGNC